MKGAEAYEEGLLKAFGAVVGAEGRRWAEEVNVVVGERTRDCIDADPEKPATIYYTAGGIADAMVCVHELFHLWHSKKFPDLTASAPTSGCEAAAILGELYLGSMFPEWSYAVLRRMTGHHNEETMLLAVQAMRMFGGSYGERVRWLLLPH